MKTTCNLVLGILLGIGDLCGRQAVAEDVSPIPIDRGLAGMYAGVVSGGLVAAGGANFPERGPHEGGPKRWYDEVFFMPAPGAKWQLIGRLPEPSGYGVSGTYKDSLIIVGGSNSSHHFAECYELSLNRSSLTIRQLESLPRTVANASGMVVENFLYVVGGQEHPQSLASANVWRLDLANKHGRWTQISDLPGAPRILATVGAKDDALYVFGGVALSKSDGGQLVRRYLRDAYKWEGEGWVRLVDMPAPIAASPSPAFCQSDGMFILGGDDGSQIGKPLKEHAGFPRRGYRYDISKNTWSTFDLSFETRVTAPTVMWNDRYRIISGEVKPGVRSPAVMTWNQAGPSSIGVTNE